ncbi:MAG: ABC transporter permease subunit, partial [Hyphomicrobiales bacterium]|nr:ABC transporter permease subunit [Hyphomicrobiales bacterium]
TLGALGMATKAMARAGFDLYAHGFSLYSISGLVLVYGYFQVPLMAIVIAPAIDGLRSTWREAAANLGASGLQFWRLVGLPLLAPSLLSAWILLFGSAFSAYATAYALTAGNIALVTTEIASVLSGNVVSAPQIGAALSIGMIAAMTATLVLSGRLAARAARWSAR